MVAILGPGEFFGEGCLIGQPLRLATATAMVESEVMRVAKAEMIRVLHAEPAFGELFIDPSADPQQPGRGGPRRSALQLERKTPGPHAAAAGEFRQGWRAAADHTPISQETLAEIIGTTRSRVSQFMNKFRKLGFIEYNGHLQIHSSLLSVILRD